MEWNPTQNGSESARARTSTATESAAHHHKFTRITKTDCFLNPNFTRTHFILVKRY